MKKTIAALAALVLGTATLAHASNEPAPAPATPTAQPAIAPDAQNAALNAAAAYKSATGTFKAYAPADEAKGLPATVTVTGADGKDLAFALANGARGRGLDGKPLALAAIPKGASVKVLYRELDGGGLEAVEVRVVK